MPEPGTRATSQARRLACDADIIPAVLGTHSEVLDLGRTERLVNRAQRRALNLRDGGCIFSGCPRPARWTQAHHIVWVRHEALDFPDGGERPPSPDCRSNSVKLRAA